MFQAKEEKETCFSLFHSPEKSGWRKNGGIPELSHN
jgi:hypothetical protein